MSRIGKLPIQIPENVEILCDGPEITVKGKFGTLQDTVPEILKVEQKEGILVVGLEKQTRNGRALSCTLSCTVPDALRPPSVL